jgi:hypothetical protein
VLRQKKENKTESERNRDLISVIGIEEEEALKVVLQDT